MIQCNSRVTFSPLFQSVLMFATEYFWLETTVYHHDLKDSKGLSDVRDKGINTLSTFTIMQDVHNTINEFQNVLCAVCAWLYRINFQIYF